MSSGEDPISSGITSIGQFENEKGRLAEIAVQAEQGWFKWGSRFKLGPVKGLLAGALGHFQGAPWGGPFLTLDLPIGKVMGQEISVGTMQWPRVFFVNEPRGHVNDGKPANKSDVYSVYLGSVNLSAGPINLTYSKLSFLDDPWNSIPGVSFTKSVRKDVSVTASVSRNVNRKEYMYYVGATWSRPAK